MIKAMDEETRHYMEAFDEIENLLTHIHDIASLMSAYTELNDSAIDINPDVIGRIALRIVNDILRVTQIINEECLPPRTAASKSSVPCGGSQPD